MNKPISWNIFLLFTVFTGFSLHGQNSGIVPLSPEATTFTKMVSYPVNMNTGLPDISIPIWNLDVGGMQLPINLIYHPGGFRINEKSGAYGLGWGMSTDIQITRTINGVDDFSAKGYAYNTSMKPYLLGSQVNDMPQTNGQLYELAGGMSDGKPDKFNYRLLNKSGAFYILKDDNGVGYTFATAPFDNIRISFNQFSFTIIDTDGTTYRFGAEGPLSAEPDQAWAGREMSGPATATTTVTENLTTWKCLSITNPTNTESITFEYSAKSTVLFTSKPEYITYYNDANQCFSGSQYIINYPNSTNVLNAGSEFSNLLYHAPFPSLSSPKYMEYLDGKAVYFHMLWKNPAAGNQTQKKTFNAGNSGWPGRFFQSNVKGLALSAIRFRGGSISFSGTDRVNSITIQAGEEIKTVVFFYSVKAPVNLAAAKQDNDAGFEGTVYLDSLHFTRNGITYERYGFLYKNKFCFGSHLKGSDAWGYVNNTTMEAAGANLAMVRFYPGVEIMQSYFSVNCGSVDTMSYNISSYLDEYPDERLMQSGTLSRIIYPTGGFTDFDFEANRYETSFSDYGGTHIRSLLGGGLRIQKISYYEGNKYEPVKQKYYAYGEFENGDGILLGAPPVQFINGKRLYGNYKFAQTVYYGNSTIPVSGPTGIEDFPQIITSACEYSTCITLAKKETKTTYLPCSALDLGYSGGSPIYYNKVTEYDIDYGKQTGKKVLVYYPADEFNPGLNVSPTVTPGTRPNTDEKFLMENWFCGKLKAEEDYKYKEGRFVLSHRKSFQYDVYKKTKIPSVFYCYLNNLYQITGSSLTPVNLYINDRYGIKGIPVSTSDFNTQLSYIPTGAVRLTREKEEWIDDTGVTFFTEASYSYSGDYMQPREIMTRDSKGNYRRKTLKYPPEFMSDPVYNTMVNRNVLSPVIEEVVDNTYGTEIARTRTNFAYFNNWFYAPASVQTSYNGGPLVTETIFDRYDNYGNIITTTGRTGILKTYLWGYRSRFPVAEIIGADYADLSVLDIHQVVLDEAVSSSLLFSELNKLFSLGTQVQSRLFAHKPFIGLMEAVDQKGLHTAYHYDGYNRLTEVVDNQGNLLKKIEYSDLTQPASFSGYRHYVNRPVMATLCDGHFNPLARPENNNVVIKGGTFTLVDYPNADMQAITSIKNQTGQGSAYGGDVGDPTGNLGALSVYSFMGSDIYVEKPITVKIDLFQNGSVVGVLWFPDQDNVGHTTYFPEGDYQVGLSHNGSYRGNTVKYYFKQEDGSDGQYIHNGSTIHIEARKTYTLTATNQF